MGSKSIIGKSMILGTKVKKALACFEEDFDIPYADVIEMPIRFSETALAESGSVRAAKTSAFISDRSAV